MTWTNWAGSQRCAPLAVEHPDDEHSLSQVVKVAAVAGQTVKAVGTGHSFTDCACTDGRMVVLDRYARVIEVDEVNQRVTVQAGITIAELNAELARRGLAMANLGDIAYQTISGAIATATHGTGIELGGIATQVVGMTIVTGDGSVVRCSADEEPETFHAARVGVGAMGLVSTVTLQCVPAFNLHVVERGERLDSLLEHLDDDVRDNDHFEFFWVPHTGGALTKRNNRTDEPERPRGRAREFFDDYLSENIAFGALCRVGRRFPKAIPRLNHVTVGGSAGKDYIERSDKVFASPRLIHFHEMEYSIPRAAAPDALRELRAFINRSGLKISFPVEVRFTAADDIPLSTAYGEERCYIAVHVYRGMLWEQYFRGVEAIMKAVGGRPHWGKMHYRTAADLAPVYPEWDRFQAVRARLDPDGRFANQYTDRVLGPINVL
ncbi:MAG: putative FAD-linked oxidase [Acidimicrobiales bacterium]|jgi:FAD-linked oxidoreductase|nr:putative FAD-linked oxidase [Acidimicrobiales bacterium]